MDELEKAGSDLEQVNDTIETLVTGIPAPIRKNFFKAFAQLCTAAVDIPVAKLQSRASEIRAESKARVQIIERQGDTLSNNLDIPKEYINKASEKFASKVIKEQLNLDEIGMHAANNLKSEENSENSEEVNEISDDWLNEFENYAKLKSSEEMKLVFGKILSGEIRKPGTFSIRTVRIISQLDNEAAKLFQTFCSLTTSIWVDRVAIADARVISVKGDAAANNSLREYGLSFNQLNILQEYGLVISSYDAGMHYERCYINEQEKYEISIKFSNKHFLLKRKDFTDSNEKLRLTGPALTKAGLELLEIISFEIDNKYKADLEHLFESKGVEMVELKD